MCLHMHMAFFKNIICKMGEVAHLDQRVANIIPCSFNKSVGYLVRDQNRLAAPTRKTTT